MYRLIHVNVFGSVGKKINLFCGACHVVLSVCSVRLSVISVLDDPLKIKTVFEENTLIIYVQMYKDHLALK
jgi:hypothetical protein